MKKANFQLHSSFTPCGDQQEAIDKLSLGLSEGKRAQVLLGITGSGKTFTIANILQKAKRPALILAHNKTLAAQLYRELKAFFPNNAVEYFVSYYDYYQPEAYIPRTDTYIEKDFAINDRIDRMRLSATRSLIERKDVMIVASVSCIYGLGLPEYYHRMRAIFEVGKKIKRDAVLLQLVAMRYDRKDTLCERASFRSRGEVLEIVPAYEEELAFRIEFFDEEIERISLIDPLTGKVKERKEKAILYPGSHYVTPEEVRVEALSSIQRDLEERLLVFEKEGRLLEKQRLKERTLYDMEMIRETGFCKGIENYSRHFSQRKAGDPPPCLLDYFPPSFLLVVDESHQTLPQVHAMYHGDRSRKQALVEFGFRLPSAYDNRPLKFEEFYAKIPQVIYLSATPGAWEITEAKGEVVEQILRPTGLLDPEIEMRSATGQVEDILGEVAKEVKKGGRILITVLTKKLAEELSKFFQETDIKAKYLHSEIDTLERMQILRDLRLGVFDVLVGINLLREGLDIPEVSLVAVLDADKEGFLRSETSLIQTCGRAARNERGRVILYADRKTSAIRKTIEITQGRRKRQQVYNKENGIVPKTIIRPIEESWVEEILEEEKEEISVEKIDEKVLYLRKEMEKAAKELRFEDAARFRDKLRHYQSLEME